MIVWTLERETEFARLWKEGVVGEAMAEMFGLSLSAVYRAARRYGLPGRKLRIWNEDLRQIVTDQWAAGKTCSEIAVITGAASGYAVANIARQIGLSRRSACGWSREKENQLRDFWADPKLSAADISAALGMSRGAVLGKVHRMKLAPRAGVAPTEELVSFRKQLARARANERRANGATKQHGLSTVRKPSNAASVAARQTTQAPRQFKGEMTKKQLQEMLSQAVRNTAAMETAHGL